MWGVRLTYAQGGNITVGSYIRALTAILICSRLGTSTVKRTSSFRSWSLLLCPLFYPPNKLGSIELDARIERSALTFTLWLVRRVIFVLGLGRALSPQTATVLLSETSSPF